MKKVRLTSNRLRGLSTTYVQLDESDPKSRFAVGPVIEVNEDNFKKLTASSLVEVEEVSQSEADRAEGNNEGGN